jgi:nitric oxide reductase activation protein
MDRYGATMKGVDCIVVKKLTENLLKSDDFPFSNNDWNTNEPKIWAEDEVRRGTTLGTLLGKKLQVRSESRETIFSRLKRGKIDGRMVASLGYDNENVFFTNEVDQFKKANLHISIDYSGSMSGDKLRKCIVSTVAIVKACEMARNINVQVSIRSTDRGSQCLPYVAIIHDSRRDTFRQFARYMSVLQANNTTPEGLCFEAILKQLVPSTNESQSYFLNFSDGQPSYSISRGSDEIQYSGEPAAIHTKQQVKKIRESGIDVLSYFITDYGSNFEHSSDWRAFKTMYGNDAKYVNVENMFEVAKTMNELFLSKNKK